MTSVAMMVYDEHGISAFDTNGMPYSKAKAKAHGKGPRSVVWPPYPQNIQGTDADPKASKPYGCEFWKIEKRRRHRYEGEHG